MEWGKRIVGDEAIWAIYIFKRRPRAIKGQLVLKNIALFRKPLAVSTFLKETTEGHDEEKLEIIL